MPTPMSVALAVAVLCLACDARVHAQDVGRATFAEAASARGAQAMVTVPATTLLEIRLRTPISSFVTIEGTPIEGIVVAPVVVDGQVVVPFESLVSGRVADRTKTGLGIIRERSSLLLELTAIQRPGDAAAQPMTARVRMVDNARESVDGAGRIRGIRATGTLANRASGMASSVALFDPLMFAWARSSSVALLRFPNPEISLPIGTELFIELTEPLTVPRREYVLPPPISSSPDARAGLESVVSALPFRTKTPTGADSDLTSLAFVGELEAVTRAFDAAGWVNADQLSARSKYKTLRSMAENQGYDEAPMSLLMLADTAPALSLAKTLNTFAKRHHLRIFGTGQRIGTAPVWTASATHDIGIGFSRANKTFIHLIDHNIDNERNKVVNDLWLTGCIDGVELLPRPWVPKDAKNSTNEPLLTDGRIAVLRVNGCEAPKTAAPIDDQPLRVQGASGHRAARLFFSTLRNDLVRSNLIAQGIGGLIALTRRKTAEEAPERTLAIETDVFDVSDSDDVRLHFIGTDDGDPPAATAALPTRVDPEDVDTIHLSFSVGGAIFPSATLSSLSIGTDLFGPFEELVFLPSTLVEGPSLSPRVTFDAHRYLSHEIGYSHDVANFLLFLDDEEQATGARVREAGYALLIHARSRRARVRPYVAVGSVLQLVNLVEAPFRVSRGPLRSIPTSLGVFRSAFDFGRRPPLEGGGIFSVGVQYGTGVKIETSRHWLLTLDWRETLSGRPDFWTKSLPMLEGDDPSGLLQYRVIAADRLRVRRLSAGIGFVF